MEVREFVEAKVLYDRMMSLNREIEFINKKISDIEMLDEVDSFNMVLTHKIGDTTKNNYEEHDSELFVFISGLKKTTVMDVKPTQLDLLIMLKGLLSYKQSELHRLNTNLKNLGIDIVNSNLINK